MVKPLPSESSQPRLCLGFSQQKMGSIVRASPMDKRLLYPTNGSGVNKVPSSTTWHSDSHCAFFFLWNNPIPLSFYVKEKCYILYIY